MYMNTKKCDIVNYLMKEPYINQRALSEATGHSLGIVNRSLRELQEEGMLDSDYRPTAKAKDAVKASSPRNAVILAAGYGMRMVPINMEMPKGLIEVHGEPLIERLIKQLHEAGIKKIYIVVGFMKEKFEYLIDKYNVKLIVNVNYSSKNNLHSLVRAAKYLSNTYIVPCGIWCRTNPFNSTELYPWYMVSEKLTRESKIRANRKSELVETCGKEEGNTIIGIAYLTNEVSECIRSRIGDMCVDFHYDEALWEEALLKGHKMAAYARVASSEDMIVIDTYEQLRELDKKSNSLNAQAVKIAAGVFNVNTDKIKNIKVLKKGMTNRSFLFECKGKKYIMRIPGEGTGQLINRREEAEVYEKINGKGICDRINYMNPETGYKISEYFEDSRTCDPDNQQDLERCMDKLRSFHNQKLTVGHDFDIFGKIKFYETLWNGEPSIYRDYEETKKNVLSLEPFIDSHSGNKVLTHIDAVPDNFLFVRDSDGNEQVKLIDWEYAGMQDPHVDIAMFSIYAMYDREQIDNLIDIYFKGKCDDETRTKIYCYVAACGLLWSNWCEYKRNLGVEFGEYSLEQYRYAKEYYRLAKDMMERGGFNE